MDEIILVGGGWKPVSMVDVHGCVTFTLWLCGCNLRCPFCHNWRLADNDPQLCHVLDTQAILDGLESSRKLIDYFHVTGGEPLLQHSSLTLLLRIVRENIGVRISVNTNLTLYKPLEKLLEEGLVDHVATDLKLPCLYGCEGRIAGKLWELYKKSLRLLAEYGIPLELRVPVAKNISLATYKKYIGEALTELGDHPDLYVIVQSILGPPITTPRNTEWCKLHCNPSILHLEEVRNMILEILPVKVIVRSSDSAV